MPTPDYSTGPPAYVKKVLTIDATGTVVYPDIACDGFSIKNSGGQSLTITSYDPDTGALGDSTRQDTLAAGAIEGIFPGGSAGRQWPRFPTDKPMFKLTSATGTTVVITFVA